jgi:serine protease Do
MTVTLAELPASATQGQDDQGDANPHNSTIDALDGVTVQDLNPDLRQQLDVPDQIRGALVTGVDPDSNSAEAGLQRGDLIVEINRQLVTKAEDAVKLGRQAKGDQILLKIWRRQGQFGGTLYLSVDNTQKLK